ncbi:MAG: DUF6308 family protein [Actinomycetota bacterium]|nr:DUF6308 family protein [Actinomycetota bacterium]
MTPWLTVGRRDPFRFDYTEDEAKLVLAGYAFGERSLMWRGDSRAPHLQRRATTQARWAYRAYDCHPSKTTQISIEDITITAALDSRITSDVVLAVLAVAPDVSQRMTSAMAEPAFWNLTRKDLERHDPGSHAAMLWEAWMLLHGVVGADVAIPHKILHRKRPSYFPLLDGNTVLAYDRGRAWSGIWQDLNDHPDQFESLECWFSKLPQTRSGVPLERLRIHDILLWAHLASNQYDALLHAGAAVLRDNDSKG